MSAAEGVPAWARPVLEALRDAARWMHFGAERVVEGGPSPITKQHAAWLELDSCCTAALASDAGTPEGEREPPGVAEVEAFHRRAAEVGHVQALRELDESGAAPPTNAPETSTSLVHAALDRKEK